MGGTFGSPESKESKGRREVPEVTLDIWRGAGYLESIYPKFLEICKRRKVTKGASAQRLSGERERGMGIQADTEASYKWKQSEPV